MAQSLIPKSLMTSIACPRCSKLLLPPVQQCGFCDIPLCTACVKEEKFCPCCKCHFDGIPCMDVNSILEQFAVHCTKCTFTGKVQEVSEHQKSSCVSQNLDTPLSIRQAVKRMWPHLEIVSSRIMCPLRFHEGLYCRHLFASDDEVIKHLLTYHKKVQKGSPLTFSMMSGVTVNLNKSSENWVLYPLAEGFFLLQVTVNATDKTVTGRFLVNGGLEEDRHRILVNFKKLVLDSDGKNLNFVTWCMLARQYSSDHFNFKMSFADALPYCKGSKMSFGISILRS